MAAPDQRLTARCPAAWLPKCGPPLRARSARSSGPVGGLRLTHSIGRCVGSSWLVPVSGSHCGYAVGYAGVGARAAGSPDAIAILWSWVG